LDVSRKKFGKGGRILTCVVYGEGGVVQVRFHGLLLSNSYTWVFRFLFYTIMEEEWWNKLYSA